MTRNTQVLVAIVATFAFTPVVTSRADARDHRGVYRAHHGYRYFGNAYSYVPWYAPRYEPRYSYAPRYEYEVPFYGRIDSNLNPDRQMVGIND
jgi:hypothetical protein